METDVVCEMKVDPTKAPAQSQYQGKMYYFHLHAGAILMCERAQLRDADLRQLCDSIIESQRAEIDQMSAMLRQRE
jgi:uncharacterized protein (DUF305 family)